MPTAKPQRDDASPYIRLTLAIGEPPPAARVRGWAGAHLTGSPDNVPLPQLVARYGAALRQECAAQGFEPACDRPLRAQSEAAQRAAGRWARRLLREHIY